VRFPGGSPDDLATWRNNVVLVVGSTPAGHFRPLSAWSSTDFAQWTEMPGRIRGLAETGGPTSASGVVIAVDRQGAVFFSNAPGEVSFWTWASEST
jgi:hypothetical protein